MLTREELIEYIKLQDQYIDMLEADILAYEGDLCHEMIYNGLDGIMTGIGRLDAKRGALGEY